VYVSDPEEVARLQAIGVPPRPGVTLPLPSDVELAPLEHPNAAGRFNRAIVRNGITVFYDPDDPDWAVLSNGAQVRVHPKDLIPIPTGKFVPTCELIGTERVEGRAGNTVVLCDPGTPVQVITTTGDQSLVRIADNTDVWVPLSSVGDATAQIDPPSAPTPSG